MQSTEHIFASDGFVRGVWSLHASSSGGGDEVKDSWVLDDGHAMIFVELPNPG